MSRPAKHSGWKARSLVPGEGVEVGAEGPQGSSSSLLLPGRAVHLN